VPARHVRELVRREHADLAGGEPPLEQRVPEHEPPSRADADDLRVHLPCPLVRLALADVDPAGSDPARQRLDLCPHRAVAERLEARAQDERLDRRIERSEHRDDDRARQPPARPEPPREQHQQRDRGAQHGRAREHREPLPDEHLDVARARDAVAPPPPERHKPERHLDHPDEREGEERELDAPPDRAAAQPDPRRDHRERRDNRQLHDQLAHVEQAQHPRVVPAPAELGGVEVARRVKRLQVQVAGHPRPPQQGRRHEPPDREHRYRCRPARRGHLRRPR
jgi:hypothetical protein